MNPPENWANLLRRHEDEIRLASNAVGLIHGVDQQVVGTGFLVAPNVVMTTKFVWDYIDWAPERTPSGECKRPYLCMDHGDSTCEVKLFFRELLYPSGQEASQVVLIEVVGHDPVQYPFLSITNPLPPANTIIGQYAFVIGYSFHDARLPKVFEDRLLGGKYGIKRLMPGRILSLSANTFGQSDSVSDGRVDSSMFTSDISTTGGTAGGPIIDLSTGKVLGVSFGGAWRGEGEIFVRADDPPRRN